MLFFSHWWDLESTGRFVFRPELLFVFCLILLQQLLLFPVLPPFYCLPFFLGLAFTNLPLTWPSTLSELRGLIRDPPLWDLRSPPIPEVFQSHPPLCPQKHFPSLTLRSILTWPSFCHWYSLSWPFHEKFLLCYDSCLVGYQSGTRCALPSQVLPPLLFRYSRMAASLCLGQVGFSSVTLSSSYFPVYFSPPFHCTQLFLSPDSWNGLVWSDSGFSFGP